MNQKEIRDLVQGPMLLAPTPFDEDFEIDFGKIAHLTNFWVEHGVVSGSAAIKVAAAVGEGPMLSDVEWPLLLRSVVRAAQGRVPVLMGLHYKDTYRTIEDAKIAQDLGAVALQVCPPVFNLPSQEDILDYFEDLSDAIDIGIMVYHTHWIRGGRIEVDTLERMSDFEQVMAVKWSNPEGVRYEEMSRLSERFNIIDNTVNPVRCHILGGRGYVQTTIEAYPSHDLEVWRLMEEGRYQEAERMYDAVMGPLRQFGEKISVRSGGQGRLTKAMMDIMGMPVGSSRPPSKPLDPDEMSELRELVTSFRWPVSSTS